MRPVFTVDLIWLEGVWKHSTGMARKAKSPLASSLTVP